MKLLDVQIEIGKIYKIKDYKHIKEISVLCTGYSHNNTIMRGLPLLSFVKENTRSQYLCERIDFYGQYTVKSIRESEYYPSLKSLIKLFFYIEQDDNYRKMLK